MSPEEELDWFDKYSKGELSPNEVQELEDYLKNSESSRKRYRQYLRFDAYLQIQSQAETELAKEDLSPKANVSETKSVSNIIPIFLSAAALLLIAITSIFLLQNNQSSPAIETEESQIKGYAVIRRLLNDEWNNQSPYKIGDLVSDDTIELKNGLVQIDFFCGASVVLQGPAKLEVTSAWSATCHEGELRAVVPPAARGFKIQTAQGQIEDLGTEFSVSVRDQQSRVHVIDGKVLVHKENLKTREMNTGDHLQVSNTSFEELTTQIPIAGLDEIRSGALGRHEASFLRWEGHRDQLMVDQRLRAYFPMDLKHWVDNQILNQSPIPATASNHAIMLGFANQQKGRFEKEKLALDVRRPDARARVFIEGTFKAYTFFTWVRIDSLAHQYNALFMGDNYNNGEPHWQIREDGKLMISVMVNEDWRGVRPDYHKVYFSPVFWDESLSGKWIQIASTYDPVNKKVANYFNGELLDSQPIQDKFYIEELKIGGSEIGSWGLPFKAEDSHFALRNLNGLIDELMIFDEALSAEEIKDLYERSRP